MELKNNLLVLENVQIVDDPFGSHTHMDPFHAIVRSKKRKGIMVSGVWSEEITTFIKNNSDIKAVYLNSARGWEGVNYSFLKDLKTIEELHILSEKKAQNITAIEEMSCLVDLDVTVITKDKVDFRKLLSLKKCFLSYWDGAESILSCANLQYLYLDKLKLIKNQNLSALKNLKILILGNSSIEDICWMSDLQNLIVLELYNCKKINDFSTLSNMLQLKKLVIDGNNNINNINFIRYLSNLEFLSLSDCPNLESIKPLVHNKKIRAFSFAGRTIIKDGDLSPLEDLPYLSMLMFQGRRHYTHKLIKKWNWENFKCPDKLLEKLRG